MTHRFDLTVYYEDTDMAGVVYHANYLKFIERARSDWVASLGVDQNSLRVTGEVFAVRRIAAEYLAPAEFGDVLRVETQGCLDNASAVAAGPGGLARSGQIVHCRGRNRHGRAGKPADPPASGNTPSAGVIIASA